MKKFLISMLVILVGLLMTPSLFALEFSADVVHQSAGGRAKMTKMYMGNNKFRTEGMGYGNYVIMRKDIMTSWMVMPKNKSYMEMKADTSDIPDAKLKGEVTRTLIGSETIDGHPTKKYEVTYKDGKYTYRSYQWVATDLNFPIKTASIDGKSVTEYKNIKVGPQPGSLFEVPAGYTKTAMPVMKGRMKGKRSQE